MTYLLGLMLVWLLTLAAFLLVWNGRLRALWREPVFSSPILLLESDDWGAGPPEQAAALVALADCLDQQRDSDGHPAVMTLALVLALPEPGMAGHRDLTAPEIQAILAGQTRGVFALQLHGMMHFWPEAVTAAAATRPEVAAWLQAPAVTEHLPSELQSRWTDASVLPSRPHAPAAVARAVAEETGLYAELFGAAPAVVVPPTFVWTEDVESAWAAAGVQVVITPGRRHTGRGADGRPAGVDRTILNGQRGAGNVLYLVRDDYFEPSFGHRPEQALAALARKTALGRPCLLETHRWNFLAVTGGDLNASLAAIDALYTQARRKHPTLRFASCEELGHAIRGNDPAWIEQDPRRRFTIWLRRAAEVPRFGKLAHLSGLFILLNLFSRPDHPRP